MFIAAPWLSAMRVPLTWQRLVVLPEILVTKAASPKPISRNALAEIVVARQFANPAGRASGELAERREGCLNGARSLRTETEYQEQNQKKAPGQTT